MNWPLPQDFNEAVQNPASAFNDPDLKAGQAVVGPTGLPLPRSGNFADVYQIRAADGRSWAVKCFTRPVTGLEQRYAKVDAALEKAGLPFTIGFTFLNEGVRVRGKWLPAVKMEWVDGLLLNQVVRDQAGNPKVLDALCQMWARLCKRLREAGIAHADLQHGNVLLVPGSKPGSYGLKLIDYDGMYVPALANSPSGEAGHPNFQHPARAAKQVYSPDLDRFPHLVIATALKGLTVVGPPLWERYDSGDNMLFSEDDFRNPPASKLMRELWETKNPGLQALVGQLAIACGKPVPQTPWLDQVAPDGIAVPLSPEQSRAAVAALDLAPPSVAVPVPAIAAPAAVAQAMAAPPAAAGADAFAGFDVEPDPAPAPRRKKPRPEPKAKKSSPVLPIAIASGVLLLLGGVIGAVVLLGGKKPVETVQNEPDDQKSDDRGRQKQPGVKGPPQLPITDSQRPGVGQLPPDRVPIIPPPPLVGPGEAMPAWTAKIDDTESMKRGPLGFDRSGAAVLVGSFHIGGVRGFDARTGKPLPPIVGHTFRNVYQFLPVEGGRAAVYNVGERAVCVWDPMSGRGGEKITAPVGPDLSSGRVGMSPNGRYMSVVKGTLKFADRTVQGHVWLVESITGKQILSTDFEGGTAHFTADSSRVLVAERNGKCRWYKLPSGEPDGGWQVGDQRASGTNPVVAVSADGTVVLYRGALPGVGGSYHALDGKTGKPIHSFPGSLTSGDATFPISDDGRFVVLVTLPAFMAADGPVAEVFDTATGGIVARARVSDDPRASASASLSGDGKRLVTYAAGTGDLRVFDLAGGGAVAGRPAPVPPVPPAPVLPGMPVQLRPRWSVDDDSKIVQEFVFDRDGGVVAFASRTGGPVRAYKLADGGALPGFSGHRSTVYGLFPAGRGKMGSYMVGEKGITVWDIKTGNQVGVIPCPTAEFPRGPGRIVNIGGFSHLTASADGRYASASNPGAFQGDPMDKVRLPGIFKLADTATGRQVLSVDWLGGTAYFAPDMSRVLLAEHSGRFRRFKLPTGQPDGDWQLPKMLSRELGKLNRTVSASADGRVLVYWGVVGESAPAFYTIDGRTGKVLRPLAQGYHPQFGSVSADGRIVALIRTTPPPGGGRTVDLLDAQTGAVVGQATLNQFGPFAFTPDGRGLIAHEKGKLTLFDLPNGGGAVGPQAKNRDPVIVPPKPADPPLPPPGGTNPLWTAAASANAGWCYATFTSDGDTVVVGTSVAGGVRSFNARTGAPLPMAEAARPAHTALIPLDRGRIGVYLHSEFAVVVWDPKTGTMAGKIPLPGDKPTARPLVWLSPNERFLVVASKISFKPNQDDPKRGTFVPGEFRVYDTATGNEVLKTDWFDESVHFTADSTRLLLSESNQRFRWYKLPTNPGSPALLQLTATLGNGRSTWGESRVLGTSADGKSILYEGPSLTPPRKRSLLLLDGRNGATVRRLADSASGPGALSPDGRTAVRLAVGKQDEGASVEVIDTATARATARFKVSPEVKRPFYGFDLSPDGRSVVVYDLGAGRVAVYDLPNGLQSVGPKPKTPNPVVVNPTPKDPDPVIVPKPKDSTPPTPAPKLADRKPVPDDAAVAKAGTKLRDDLKTDYAKKLPAEKRGLAQKLLGLAEAAADPATRYVMLRDARDLAIEVSDPPLTMQAVDGLLRWYDLDPDQVKLPALEKLKYKVGNTTALRAVVDFALVAGDTAAATDRHETAVKYAELAVTAARRANIPAVIEETEAELTKAKKAAEAFASVKAALDQLRTGPNDRDAALIVGKHRCFAQGRWDEGLKFLAGGGAGGLKAAAELDAATPRTGVPDVKAADAWWEYSRSAPEPEKSAAEARARYWYARALPGLPADRRADVEKRLALSVNGVEYRPGLLAEFTAKVPSILKGKKARIDPDVTFTGDEFKAEGIGKATDVTVKWSGVIVAPRPGRYKLVTVATDPVRVRLDGKAVIDTTATKTTRRETIVVFPDRPTAIAVEFTCLNTDKHNLKLCWVAPGGETEELIPPEALFHGRKAEGALGKAP